MPVIIISESPSLRTKKRCKLPKASDIYWIRMLTQLIAGGRIESCDPSGQCKDIQEAGLAKATGGDATM